MSNEVTVFIVDDDESIRHSLRWLLESAKLSVEDYPSADEFLYHVDTDHVGCLILDVRMPGMSGLELQEALLEKTSTLPIIILTGHGDVPMAVRAMSQGSFDFVQKPFNGPQLLERVQSAIEYSQRLSQEKSTRTEILKRYETLTPREQQVMGHIVSGSANKVIAIDMDIGLRTVEVHRHRVMEKMQARSVADLVHYHLQLNPGN